ncbi:hypothetical protein ACIF9R_07740 [Streptomyces sp. NPDC086080]|uniref:hypothetical protein n=1 Tax=Streptomyces sp. NPDC086080 TaxID=3365748 RepID=UPI0037D96FDD
MADEQCRWLDRGTAERLLNGEPPEPAEPTTRDQAKRLAATLHALAAPPPAADGELPGEAAALAAFRALREEREGRADPVTGAGEDAGTADSDVGLIRIGTPRGDRSGTADGRRDRRSLRFGLAAALVAGLVGGAAILAGAGLLPAPSDASGTAPAASASATHPERPPLSLPPETGGATPEGRHSESRTGEHGVEAHREGDPGAGGPSTAGASGADSGDPAVRSGRGGKQIASACRAWRDGENLNGERERLLEDAAGGPARIGPYCAGTLSSGKGGAGTGSTAGKGAETETSKGRGVGKGPGPEKNNGNGQNNGNGNGQNNGNGPGKDNNSSNSSNSNKNNNSDKGNKGGNEGQGAGKSQEDQS